MLDQNRITTSWAMSLQSSYEVARERIELNFKHAQLLSYWLDFASTYLIFSAWSLLREKSSTLSALSLTVWPEIDLNWLSVWVWEWCPSMLILFSFSLRAPLQLSQIWLWALLKWGLAEQYYQHWISGTCIFSLRRAVQQRCILSAGISREESSQSSHEFELLSILQSCCVESVSFAQMSL